MRKNAKTKKINDPVTGTPKVFQRRKSINIEHKKDYMWKG